MQGSFAPGGEGRHKRQKILLASDEGGLEVIEEDEIQELSSARLGAGPGTQWRDVLDPGVDERTEKAYRDGLAEARRTGNAAPQEPVPPDISFTYKGRTVYILKDGDEGQGLRTGVLGHYIVPYSRSPANNTAVPFPTPGVLIHNPRPVPAGAPGHPRPGVADARPRPNILYCEVNKHYIVPDGKYMEIGLHSLRAILEEAESLDFAFSKRMEGLQNASSSVVWDCLDPDFNPADRQAVLAQFMGKYLDRLYTQFNPGADPDVAIVSGEALHEHKAFCKEWVQKHYKSLTPLITSNAEILTGDFFNKISATTQGAGGLTRMEMARFFMRNEDFAWSFASALYFHTTNLDHVRGGRNASITQTRNSMTLKAQEYNRFGRLLLEKMESLHDLARVHAAARPFAIEKYTVDWYGILGQMPHIHRYFDDITRYTQAGVRPFQRRGQPQIPPWRVGMDQRP